ncbi:hypothetical protein Ciccas_007917, partial [Cichlidogyrus casuarinus]
RWIVGHRGYLLVVIWLTESLNAFLWAEVSQYPWLFSEHYVHSSTDVARWQLICYTICYAIHGLCSGAAMTLMIIVLMDFVGPDRLSKSLAITFICVGIFYGPSFFVLGMLGDRTRSFAWSIRCCAFLLLAAAFILFMELPTRMLLDDPHSARLRKQRLVAKKVDLDETVKSVDGMTPPMKRWAA